MIPESIIDALYAGQRSETYPLAVNDVVCVKAGARAGATAWVISLRSEAPAVKYLIEYEDGSDEVVALTELEGKDP